MSDLTGFLVARLDEDEAIAREAAGLSECWVAEEPAIGVVLVDGEPLIEGHIAGLAAHIARHDPARVLREVQAKRAILAEHEPQPWGEPHPELRRCPAHGDETTGWWTAWPCVEIRALAAVWSDHPDYDEAWRPGA